MTITPKDYAQVMIPGARIVGKGVTWHIEEVAWARDVTEGDWVGYPNTLIAKVTYKVKVTRAKKTVWNAVFDFTKNGKIVKGLTTRFREQKGKLDQNYSLDPCNLTSEMSQWMGMTPVIEIEEGGTYDLFQQTARAIKTHLSMSAEDDELINKFFS